MPRVHKLKARKDYPNVGVEKGTFYYKWTTRPGGRGNGIIHRSPTYPKPWLLTSSPFLQQQYQLEHRLSELTYGEVSEEVRDEIAQEIREMGEECEEKIQNMPESLQYSPSGEMLQERADACGQWADELEAVDIPLIEDLEEPEMPDEDASQEDQDQYDEDQQRYEEQEDAVQSALEELQNCAYSG